MSASPYCWQALALFERWRENPAAELESVWQEHLATCSLCQAEGLSLEALQQAWDALEQMPVPLLGTDFELRLQARIAEREGHLRQHQQRWQRIDSWFDWLHLPAVAVAMSLFVFARGAELPQAALSPELRQEQAQRVQQWLETPLSDVMQTLQNVYPKSVIKQEKTRKERRADDEMV